VLRAVAGLVVPPACSICDASVAPADSICARCRHALSLLGPLRSSVGDLEVLSAARYEGVARRLVARLKFSSRLVLAEVAADRMAAAADAGIAAGVLVPVPAAPSRQRARGFDTASYLTRLISRRTRCPVVECLARRDARRQFGRPRSERLADPPRIEWSRRVAGPPAGPVWIVDDVATTGATLAACARVLRDAGADEVRALTFARAI
jgi:ComF family protein